MIIDHICYAVKNLNDGILFWENVFGYRQMTRIVENSRQKVKVTFLTKENSITIKLIQPTDANQTLLNFITKGGSYHHICFKCSNMNEKLDELKGKGMIPLVLPQPGEAFNNHDIAFLLARNGLNIELIDTDEKAERIDAV